MRIALAALALLAALCCGPRKEAEEPGDEQGLELIPSPVVSFPANLDIELEIPSDPGTLPSPQVLWSAGPAGALGIAGHLVVIASDREGTVEARDVRDGSRVWDASIPACPVCAFRLNPVFDGERVIVSSGSRLLALDARDGAERWSLDLTGLPDGAPMLLEDRILVLRTLERVPGPSCSSVTTRILFVETSTGSPLWRIEFVGLLADFAAAGGFLHVLLSGGCDPVTGGPSSQHAVRIYRLEDREVTDEASVSPAVLPPAVAGGHILTVAIDGLTAVDPGTVTSVWKSAAGQGVPQSLTTCDESVVVVGSDRLSLLDAVTGTPLYQTSLGDVRFRQGLNVLPTVAVTGTYILVPMEPDPLRGYIVVFDRDTGKVKRMFRGFGPVLQTLAWGGIGVLLLADEVVAVDLVGEGTPERDLVPVPAAVTKMVLDLEQDVPFVPWSAAAEEVRRLGHEGLATLLKLADEEGSLVAALIAARLVASEPTGKNVADLIGFLSMPAPGTGDLVHVHGRMIYETIRALAAEADPAATQPLREIVEDDGLEPALRSASLAALGAIAAGGHEEALDAIASYRKARAAASSAGWSPCPLPGPLFQLDGPFRVASSSCKMSVDTPFSSTRSVSTPDSEWLAYVSPALGGRNDVWLAHVEKGKIDGPWFTARTVPGLIELQFLDRAQDGTLLLESVERECEGCYLEEEDRPESGKPVETRLDPAALAQDSDKDGWTDLVEQRLGTNPKKKDTDADGRRDPRDPAPLGSQKSAAKMSDRQKTLEAAVFTLLGFGGSDEPLFVFGPPATNLPYEGYAAAVLHVSPERARSIQKSLGIPGPPFLGFGCPMDEKGNIVPDCQHDESEQGDPLGFVMMSDGGTRASLSLTIYRSNTDVALYRVELARISSTWVVTRFDLAGFF